MGFGWACRYCNPLVLKAEIPNKSEAPVSPKIDKGDTRTGKLEGDCTEDESGQPDIEEIDSFIAMPESLDEFIKILRSGNVPIDALEELGGIRNCYRCGASILRPEQFAVAVLDYYGETPDSDIVELVALSEEARGDYLPEVESVDISGTCQWCGRQMSKDGDEPRCLPRRRPRKTTPVQQKLRKRTSLRWVLLQS